MKDGNVRAMLPTLEKEAFCCAYVDTSNASEAYQRFHNADNVRT